MLEFKAGEQSKTYHTGQWTNNYLHFACRSGTIKRTPPGSPGRYKQNSGSFENITGVTTQEAIVERAKQVSLKEQGLHSGTPVSPIM